MDHRVGAVGGGYWVGHRVSWVGPRPGAEGSGVPYAGAGPADARLGTGTLHRAARPPCAAGLGRRGRRTGGRGGPRTPGRGGRTGPWRGPIAGRRRLERRGTGPG